MKKPEYLKNKSSISVVAPSTSPIYEPYKTRNLNSIKNFENLGHTVFESPSTKLAKQFRSNTAEIRANEFMAAYLDPNTDVVFSASGGIFMMEILPFIDFKKIKNSRPKWFVGFSDNTNLTFTLTTICEVQSLYAPVFTEFGMNQWHKSLQDSYDFLTGKKSQFFSYDKHQLKSINKQEGHYLDGYNLTEKTDYHCFNFNYVKEQGILLGGCLDILQNICGTKFDNVKNYIEKYKEKGYIWFFESCDLTIDMQSRALWQLKNAGWLKYAKAIIIGRPKNTTAIADIDYYHCNFCQLENLNIPVIINADFGHVPPALPMVTGAEAIIEFKDNKFSIKYLNS